MLLNGQKSPQIAKTAIVIPTSALRGHQLLVSEFQPCFFNRMLMMQRSLGKFSALKSPETSQNGPKL